MCLFELCLVFSANYESDAAIHCTPPSRPQFNERRIIRMAFLPPTCANLEASERLASSGILRLGFSYRAHSQFRTQPFHNKSTNVVSCNIFMSNYRFCTCWGAASSGQSPAPSQQVCLGEHQLTWWPPGQGSPGGKLFIDVPA